MTNSPIETEKNAGEMQPRTWWGLYNTPADETAASNAAGVEEDSVEPKGDGEGDVWKGRVGRRGTMKEELRQSLMMMEGMT
jgi:hypothetical protein